MGRVTVIKDTKFKNIFVSVRFLSVLKEADVVANMVLANILNESCNKYPSKQSVADVLDDMYGASISITSNVVGRAQLIVCRGKIIHPCYITKQNQLLEDQFSLFREFLLSPLMVQGKFNNNVFEEAKRNVKDHMARANDDPSTYCMYQAMRIAGDKQPLAWGVSGTESDVDAVSMEEVVRLYHEMITDTHVDVLVLGDVEESVIHTLSSTYLPFETNKEDVEESVYKLALTNQPKRQEAYKEITQSYITYLYTCDVTNKDEEFAALRVANAILGQLPTSLLFQEVREKNSLCYSIYSALFPYDGALGINTGVDKENIEKASDLIELQVERMKTGDFDTSLMEGAKRMLVNSLHATADDADSIFALEYRNILFGRTEGVEAVVKNINNVCKEDIIKVMNKMELSLSYIVKARDEDE